MNNVIKTNEKRKQEQKIQKQIFKAQKKILKRKVYFDKLKRTAIQKSIDSINSRYKKKLSLFEKKQQEELEKLKKNLNRVKNNKKVVKYKKKDKTLSWYKKHSLSDFQWCIRYNSKDINGYVKTIDGKSIKWDKCDAGHIFPKSKYPHIAFNVDNCFPQSKRSNKELGANEGIKYKDEIINRIGKSRWNKLLKLADNELERNKLRNKSRRKEKYEYWHKKRFNINN